MKNNENNKINDKNKNNKFLRLLQCSVYVMTDKMWAKEATYLAYVRTFSYHTLFIVID